MTINGPRLTDSKTAQAFMIDLRNRPQHVTESIDTAMDGLADLPVGDWTPDRDAEEYVQRAQTMKLGRAYVRGVLACGLVVGQEIGHHIFYTEPEPMTPYGKPGVGALLRVNDTLVAARTAFSFLNCWHLFEGFHPGHAEVLLALTDTANKIAGDRLRETRETYEQR